MTIPRREFGGTGLRVSVLGFGAGHIGDAAMPEPDVERLLNAVLDLGINLIDTARGYGLSEDRIGKYLSHRRHEFVLSTKVGYSIPGFQDWTGPIISAGVSAALKRLRTDYIDIVHLHSCPRKVLEQGEVVSALRDEVRAGRVRVAAYSGDNDALGFALTGGQFAGVQCSVNLTDQRPIDTHVRTAQTKNIGVIAKRPLANAPWRFSSRPAGDYAEVYWERFQQMKLDSFGLEWPELALRFVAFLPGVHSCIVGTRRLDHFRRNADWLSRGPLAPEQTQALRTAFQVHDRDWQAQT